MTTLGSKKQSKNIPSNDPKEKGSVWAWIGSIFLWFITPTGASALWEKWLNAREREQEEKDSEKEKASSKDSSNQS